MENQNINQEMIDKFSADQEFLRSMEAIVTLCGCREMEESLDNIMTSALLSDDTNVEMVRNAHYNLLQAKALWRQVREYLELEVSQEEAFLIRKKKHASRK